MKNQNYRLVTAALMVAGLGLVGCASTPENRIAADRAAFQSWPTEVQSKVETGEVAVGFTESQVRMAMGEPERVVTRTGKDGERKIWDYAKSKPGFSIGLGVGGGGGSTRVGGGIGVGTGGKRELVSRVVFAEGAVESIETAGTK